MKADKSRKTNTEIRFGCFTIRDRKTDHDPLASRTDSLHHLPKSGKAAEALPYLRRWLEYAQEKLRHKWRDEDCAFPSLTKIPRGGPQRLRRNESTAPDDGLFRKVGIKWGSPMSDSKCSTLLQKPRESAKAFWAMTSGSLRIVFAEGVLSTGWAPSEKAETVTRYLLDDVLDREENLLGDSLAPDAESFPVPH
ncbi:hypothetical protein GQ600_21325 [Phytophthora cactorum]|nr:hypothetical protein GQ600_21325 [Phytophthora cactorum]